METDTAASQRSLNFLYLDTADIRACRIDSEKLRVVREWCARAGAHLVISPIHIFELEQGGMANAESDLEWVRKSFPSAYILPSITDAVTAQLEAARNGQSAFNLVLVPFDKCRPIASILRDHTVHEFGVREHLISTVLLHAGMRHIGESYTSSWAQVTSRWTWSSIRRSLWKVHGATLTREEFSQAARTLIRGKKGRPNHWAEVLADRAVAHAATEARRSPLGRALKILVSSAITRVFLRFLDRYIGGPAEHDLVIIGMNFFIQHFISTRETPAEFMKKHPNWQQMPVGLSILTRSARLRNRNQKVAPGDLLDELHLLYMMRGSRMTVDQRTMQFARQGMRDSQSEELVACLVRTGIRTDDWIGAK